MRRTVLMIAALAALAASLAAAPGASADSTSRLVAPASACPGSGDLGESTASQERAMLCMTNFARHRAGLRELADARALDRSAVHRSGDILRCDSFSHEACGRAFTYWMGRFGYLSDPCWRAGENIAWGSGSYATVRAIFNGWMHSREHRENILGRYRQIGIGLRVGGLEGNPGAHVWTQDFGARC
jgi:uncharacterized protein YkwD